jgi:DNA-binding IclR family transcriptional regulator
MPHDQLKYLLSAKEFAGHNGHTIISKNSLKRELALVRQSGYAWTMKKMNLMFDVLGPGSSKKMGHAVAAIVLLLSGTSAVLHLWSSHRHSQSHHRRFFIRGVQWIRCI